jgi:hypothetical protein
MFASIKWFSLQKSGIYFTLKKVYDIDPSWSTSLNQPGVNVMKLLSFIAADEA